MHMEFVDLYQEFDVERPVNGVGRLTAWILKTPDGVSDSRKRPAVLILPGGAYSYTSQREAAPVAMRFLAAGFQAFVLEYTCAPAPYPVALREAAMAMCHIRRNAERYGVDSGMVAATGFSAGGHLCGTLGMLYDAPELNCVGRGAEIRPDALGLCYPVTISHDKTHQESIRNVSGGDPELAKKLSLETLVRPDMPPVFLWHTRDDGSVPLMGTLLLAGAMDAAGVDFALHVYRHGPHGVSTADEMVYKAGQVPDMSWDVPGWIDAEIRFFSESGLKIQDN